jgi:Tol biopolymer transport system component
MPTGSDLAPLTDTPRLTEYAPIFSPDGARIAFLFDDAQEGYGFSDIFTMAVDGSDVRRLTHTPKRREFPRSWQAVSP